MSGFVGINHRKEKVPSIDCSKLAWVKYLALFAFNGAVFNFTLELYSLLLRYNEYYIMSKNE